MEFMTEQQKVKMLDNGAEENYGKDHIPVIKLFLPMSACTWLLTELVPDKQHIAFGLCDLGLGFPELGYVDLDELASVKNRLQMSVERDKGFVGVCPLSVYQAAAREYEQVVDHYEILRQFANGKVAETPAFD